MPAGASHYFVRGTPVILQDARALGVDDRGQFYIVDAGATVVRMIAPSCGLDCPSMGGPGTGIDALFGPTDVDPTNGQSIYVTDETVGVIIRYTETRRMAEVFPVVPEIGPIRELGLTGRASPVAVAAGPGGILYVADADRRVVLVLNATRATGRILGREGAGALVEPIGLAVLPDGSVAVADAGRGEVLIFDAFGAFRFAVSTDELGRLVGVSRDRSGRLLAVGQTGVATILLEGRLGTARLLSFAPEQIVDAALIDDDLIVLTPTRLVTIPWDAE
jgi:DNA-binding beta-propeller fold protein YncE